MSKNNHEKPFQSEKYLCETILRIQSDSELRLLPIQKVNIISGGVSHYVFELILKNGSRLYLKKRAKQFSQLPQIKSNPEEIKYEFLILKHLQELFPNNFPEVILFSEEGNYLVLTDAMPKEADKKLDDLFLQNKVNTQIISMLGTTLSNIHTQTRNYTNPIRVPNDEQHYQLKLFHRLGCRNHPILNWAIEQLSSLPNKQLVLGDPAPKNIGITNNGESCTFFDMEEAHLGDTLFDYAYFLGHVIVHNLNNIESLLKQVSTFENSYNHNFDPKLVKIIALGIVLYRLNSVVPYPLSIPQNLRKNFENRIERDVLFDNLSSMSWQEIIESIHV